MHTTVGLGSMDFKGSSPLVGDVVGTVGSRVSIGVSLGDDEGDFKMTKIRFVRKCLVVSVIIERYQMNETYL